MSKYTIPKSFVGMTVPTKVVGMLVASALPTKVVGMKYVNFSTHYKNVKSFEFNVLMVQLKSIQLLLLFKSYNHYYT